MRVRFSLSLSLYHYESNTFNTSIRNITKNSLRSRVRSFRSFDRKVNEVTTKRGGKYNTYIYIYIYPPLPFLLPLEHIGFEFWVWVNSMKTRPNREPFVNFRSPRSRKYFAHGYPINILRRILSPSPPSMCARSRLRSGYIARVSIESLSKTLKYQRAAGFSGIELPGNTIAVDAIRLYFCDY